MAFKTKEVEWINTTYPAVVLLSVHSMFNEGIDGYFKMATLLSTIRENIKGKISVLIADTAHLHTLRLVHTKDPLGHCIESAKEMALRYQSYMEGFEVLYWSSYVMGDNDYRESRDQLKQLVHTNSTFRDTLFMDAEAAYTEKRKIEFPDKELFLEKMMEDLIEQCICMQILAKQGYRYLFYPGAPCDSTEYVNCHCIPFDHYLHWIDVFVTIEKKTKIFQGSA